MPLVPDHHHDDSLITRRGIFIGAAVSLICAPAIVRVTSLMQVRRTDAYTNELFPRTQVEAGRVIFPISQLVCDVERFPSDGDDPMATRGMGVIYTRTAMGEVLRAQPGAADRESLLDRRYRPHHLKLERMVHDVVVQSGSCLIVDCHGFPSIALPYEPDQTPHRADICIGTDSEGAGPDSGGHATSEKDKQITMPSDGAT